jgi:hypothetical protein
MATFEEMYQKAKERGKLVDLDPAFVKLAKPGDTIIGRYVRKDSVNARAGGGSFDVYVFETDAGLVKTKFGAATDKGAARGMVEGRVYRVEFLGKDKLPEGNDVNRWSIVEVPTLV